MKISRYGDRGFQVLWWPLDATRRSYRAELRAVTLAALLDHDASLEPLANEVIGVQLLVRGEPSVEAGLEDLPGFRAYLDGPVFGAGRVVEEAETPIFTFGHPQREL